MVHNKSIISTGRKQIGKKEYHWEVTEVTLDGKVMEPESKGFTFQTIKIFTTYTCQDKLSRDYSLPLGDYGTQIISEIMAAAAADIATPKVPFSQDGDDIAW